MVLKKVKFLSKVIIIFFTCGLFVNYFQEDAVTNSREGRISTHGDASKLFESPHMKLMLTIVSLPKSKLESVKQIINSTWGAEDTVHYKLAVGASIGKDSHLADTLQAIECSEFKLDNPKQLYCLLKAIYNHHINEYKWFLITSELIYPSMQKLEKYLLSLNPHAFLYIGEQAPGFGYCSLKSGLLLSRKALQVVVNELEACMVSGGAGEAGDMVLGWCIAEIVHESCLEMKAVNTLLSD